MNEILMQGTGRFGWKVARLAAPLAVGVCMAALSGCRALDNSESDGDFHHRVYVGAGVLVSQLEPDTDGVAGTSVGDSMDGGASLTLGYDASHRFSVEGHLASLGEAVIDPAGTIGYSVAGVSGLYYGFNDARSRARREGFAAFGRLGLGAMENDGGGVEFERINEMHLLVGVGLEYGTRRGLGLRAEIVAHETDAKYAQLGLVYRFGTHEGRAWEIVPGSVNRAPVVDVPIASPSLEELPPVPMADVQPVVELPAVKAAPLSQQDADGDTVPDADDQCPDTVANALVNVNGCPILGGVVDGINFRAGSDKLVDASIIVLADIAETLRENPDIRIIIEAHTDNRGKAADNLQLSKRRAIAVARYLIGAGISGSRLKPQAYGESRPRSTNLTALGRAANRRVEFVVFP